MREIKFRLWKEREGLEIELVDKVTLSQIRDYEEDDYTIVDQFTGLLDKLGKEIYEGDILKLKRGGDLQDLLEVVEYGIYGWKPWEDGTGDRYFTISEEEVIGNIYENSELIKRAYQGGQGMSKDDPTVYDNTPRKMELPSKVEAAQAIVYDCTKAKRDRVLLEIAQAYVDGKLIEPLSREELAGALARAYCTKENEHKEMDITLVSAMVDEALGKVQEDKPHLELTEEEIAKTIAACDGEFRDVLLTNFTGKTVFYFYKNIAHEIVKAMKGVK